MGVLRTASTSTYERFLVQCPFTFLLELVFPTGQSRRKSTISFAHPINISARHIPMCTSMPQAGSQSETERGKARFSQL